MLLDKITNRKNDSIALYFTLQSNIDVLMNISPPIKLIKTLRTIESVYSCVSVRVPDFLMFKVYLAYRSRNLMQFQTTACKRIFFVGISIPYPLLLTVTTYLELSPTCKSRQRQRSLTRLLRSIF